MKTVRFLLTAVGFGALTLGLCFADELSWQPDERNSPEKHATSNQSAEPAEPASGSRERKPENTNEKPSKPKEPNEHPKPKEPSEHSKPKEDSRPPEKGGPARSLKPLTKRLSGKEPHPIEPKKPGTAATVELMKNRTENYREQLARQAAARETASPKLVVAPSRRTAGAAARGKALGVAGMISNAGSSVGPLNNKTFQRKF